MRCLIWRKISRILRFARFRATAFPIFFEAMMPNLFLSNSFGREKMMHNFSTNFFSPSAITFSKSGRLASRSVFLKEKFPIESDCQAFSAFSPAVCQYTSSPYGRTSFTESVHTFSFDITGLKSPFHESVLKIILQNAKNPALLLPNQMVRQLEILREGLEDYFTGGNPCQGLIPFFQGRRARFW